MQRADYSLRIKREMLAGVSQLPCCHQSFLAGLLSGSDQSPFVRTRRGLIKRLIKKLYLILGESQKVVFSGSTISLPGVSLLSLRQKFVARFKMLDQDSQGSKHCQNSFMQGLFIAHGYVQNPGRGYHLEFRIRGRWLKSAFKKTSRFLKMRFSSFEKGRFSIFYCKNSRRIIKILNQLGVFEKALELSDFLATRKLLSMVNRQVNSETGNINRQISAAEKSILQIQQLIELPEQDFWTENLFQTAIVRLKHPHDSIEKLGERFEPPLTKSAVNHRLRRINALFAKKIGKNEKNDDDEG
ncbi:MAG: DNA-binding protein WhiA [Candidatus Rifleibacteriota bacterium]